jgi:hypothetical protein
MHGYLVCVLCVLLCASARAACVLLPGRYAMLPCYAALPSHPSMVRALPLYHCSIVSLYARFAFYARLCYTDSEGADVLPHHS